jgi:hypothetical protein
VSHAEPCVSRLRGDNDSSDGYLRTSLSCALCRSAFLYSLFFKEEELLSLLSSVAEPNGQAALKMTPFCHPIVIAVTGMPPTPSLPENRRPAPMLLSWPVGQVGGAKGVSTRPPRAPGKERGRSGPKPNASPSGCPAAPSVSSALEAK